MNDSPAIYEFLLWNNCNNNCKFCHQKANKNKHPNKFLDNNKKLLSIKTLYKYIKNKNIKSGSHILLMGGELFDTKLSSHIESEFFKLATLIASEMENLNINLLYLNTNLIYSDISFLYDFLNIFINKNLEKRIRFTTSYDISYRYKNELDRCLVEKNMLDIYNLYPNIFKTANCILTNKACEYLSHNPLFLVDFKKKYGFNLNLIPYIKLYDSMASKRSTILSLLLKINEFDIDYIKKYVDNLSIKQDRFLFEFNGNMFINASSNNADCGHNENFRKVYLDDDRCFICDCINLKNSI